MTSRISMILISFGTNGRMKSCGMPTQISVEPICPALYFCTMERYSGTMKTVP